MSTLVRWPPGRHPGPRRFAGQVITPPVPVGPPSYARRFDGSDDQATFGIGGLSGQTGGNITLLAVCKKLTDATFDGIVTLNTTASAQWIFFGLGTDNEGFFFTGGVDDAAGSGGLTFTVADGWMLVAVTKTSGTTAPRWHKYVYATATWTHTNSANTAADLGSPGASGNLKVGAKATGADFFNADVALAGVWSSALSDVALEALPLALQDLVDASPAALISFNQAATTPALEDLTGTSDETALVGTTVVQDGPPGFDWSLAAGTNAPAEAAVGTGAADNATAAIAVNAEAATGTGAAADPLAGVGAAADQAAGTGQALDATIADGVNAGVATGIGTAPDPTAAVGVNAEVAAGTGAAFDATVSTTNATNAPAEAATGTGVAPDPTVAITVAAEAASGTGTAPDATGAVGVAAEAASGTGAAQDAQAAIQANADQATGTGAAPDPTVSTAAFTNAPAEAATGTGLAPDPTVAIAATADQAAGTGTAPQPTVATGIEASAGLAAGTGSAPDASVAIAVQAGVATGTGSAPDAVGQTSRDAPAGLASATGSALDAAVAIVAAAEAALGIGVAYDAVAFIPPPVPPPRWVEGSAAATGTVEGSSAGSGQVEGVLVGAGIVEGGSSL